MIRPATPEDLPEIRLLLAFAGLPVAGLDEARLWVLDDGGHVAGAVGYEKRGATALVRSLVVRPSRRGAGDGRRLLDRALEEARADGCRDAAALTTTIAAWLARSGWRAVDRASLPAAVQASAELQGACPGSAKAFVRGL